MTHTRKSATNVGQLPTLSRRDFTVAMAGVSLPAGLPMTSLADNRSAGSAMRASAIALLEGVGSGTRERIAFPFTAPERHRWTYVPGRRAGVFLDDMAAPERDLAMALLRASLSDDGYAKATGVMKLAAVLQQTRGFGRGPGAYAFAVFGDPRSGDPWGWRVEGHHLSLHFTAIGDQVISTTPHCVCADPTEVRDGKHAGLMPLDREDYLGRDLARNLNAEQFKRAVLAGDVPNDVRAGPRRATVTEPGGIAYADLADETQQHLILGVAEAYFLNLPRDLAKAQMARLIGEARDTLRFEWAGGFEPTDLHYYRLSGPTVSIEYSTRDRATHVHTLWRDPGNDFGRAALASAGIQALPPEGA